MKNIKIVLALFVITGLVITSAWGMFAKGTTGSEADNKAKTEKVESLTDMKTAKINNQTWYLVENEQQLRSIGTGKYSMSANYMINADITLSNMEWTPIGDYSNPFKGTFNGNGYKIKNLTITSPTAKLIGLFGYAEDAKIYNVHLTNVDISKAGRIVAIGIDCEICDNKVEA